ncbi:1-deoxy-D-xylulose-5-phosphate synthase [Candidatus Thermokryptus mobilis]|uniref:1-deoxy-D-xylulose-5-phosphate synthase n=1 Tax=Candidatus Thermokryptus mobilis TaxID=1643428 RepID=A0A0S4MSU5_9BACT|nr:1-deoxy-D-xylulose-5-phosphate synthase [Candidatus Thermokryptus mobilis]CUU02092.1 1-deoxy-D-xylulose-5-phosphate synthase [Candidatus Thermokryptus mobilis]
MGTDYRILPKVNSPDDLKSLDIRELEKLASEIREFIIDTISRVGGHLGASLGVVELTLAVHYVFNAPKDKIIWDTGHQGYVHKIITGRRDVFHTIRQFRGISGFLKRSESIYDVFGAGHASTSISAALGIATARDFDEQDYKVVAIIGDGAMTAGLAYEAMNNAGVLKKNLIVILNDNNMSISPNVWAVSKYFTELIASSHYNKLKSFVWDLTGQLDGIGDRIRRLAAKVEGGVKAIITPGMLFEALGFRYFGPVNGHNIQKLIRILSEIKNLNGPILLHVITQKGKGYKPAEEDEQKLHGVTPFDKITGKMYKSDKPQPPSYTKVFGEAVVQLARQNSKIVGITAAMPDGTGLNILKKEIPERFFDVGIAEQHAVTFSAGLATEGYVPICAIYSTFLQRAFDQIIHDVALQRLHVVFAIDRAGLVGADGPTHHGAFDLSYLRLIPNMVIMAPKDESELRDMLYTATVYNKGPVAIRYPRGNGVGVPLKKDFDLIEIGKAEVLRDGDDLAILAIGNMVYPCLRASEKLSSYGIEATVVNMRFVKPLDEGLLDYVFEKFDKVVTVEENTIRGGFGSAVLEYAAMKGVKNVGFLIHGIPDEFIEHGTQEELWRMLKLDPDGIVERILEAFEFETLKDKTKILRNGGN